MADRIVLGVDPGSSDPRKVGRHGWALLLCRPGRRPVFRGCGRDKVEPLDLLRQHGYLDLLAVEVPQVVHRIEAVRGVLDTRGSAGTFAGAASGIGLPLVEMSPGDWRYRVCKARSPSDAMVKEAILAMIEGWPQISNNHERDAAGVALAASMVPPVLIGMAKR